MGLQVGDLTKATACLHQLKVLRDAQVSDYRCEGTRNYYYLVRDTTTLDWLRYMLDAVAEAIGMMENNEKSIVG